MGSHKDRVSRLQLRSVQFTTKVLLTYVLSIGHGLQTKTWVEIKAKISYSVYGAMISPCSLAFKDQDLYLPCSAASQRVHLSGYRVGCDFEIHDMAMLKSPTQITLVPVRSID
jgi:hypothetical protein